MKKMTAFCLAVMMSLSLFGCSQAQQAEGITIVDQGGRKVTLEKPAEKVASGYYIATTTIIGLGGEDMLTGVEMKAETRPIYKAAASKLLDLPALGNKKMFHVEECAKADPDVVFLPVSLKEYAAQLEELGIATVLLNPETQEQYDEAVQIIAKVCGKEEAAEDYFAYCKELYDTYLDFEADDSKQVYMAGLDLLQAAGKDMYQAEVIHDAKGINAYAQGGNRGWQSINVETLLSLNPAYILLENGGITSEEVYADESLQELRAVKNKQVYVFPSALETWDTPNLSSCLGTLWCAAILYPQEVSMEAVEKEAIDFYKQFYDIDVTGEQLGF